jgi:hypothetical protein
METILRKPDLTRFNISDHLEFHELSFAMCVRYASFFSLLIITEYSDALNQEKAVFKWIHKSEITAKKAKTDHARDHAVKGIAAVVRNDMKHFDPTIRDHALHVYGLLEAYGNMPAADYDAETANIDSLITRLRSIGYQASVTALGLAGWIAELEAQNNLFKTYVDDFAKEQIAKPAIEPKAARQQTDDALHVATNHVTSLVILNGQSQYVAFINEFNTLVNHYNNLVHEHYGRLHARTDITPSVLGAIPEQPYTGKPVFVIPELILTVEREGKTFTLHPEFSVDFTVTYKNNVEPGTATLTITGIGKFVGEIVTTFNIIKN